MLIEAADKNHMGMVVTSHFSQVISEVADRAMLLTEGKITALGSPEEVIRTFMAGLSDTEKFEVPEFGGDIIIARDVFKRYISVDRGVVRAVNGVSFDVKEKEIFGIIG
jgi:methyl coenzyme M reductase system subunit A2